MSSKTLNREAFFAACKIHRTVSVELPDNAGNVNIRKLTLGQIREFDDAKDNYERAQLLILHSVVDADGNTIFQTKEEVAETLEMSMFKVLSEAVTEANGLRTTAADVKNSETAKT